MTDDGSSASALRVSVRKSEIGRDGSDRDLSSVVCPLTSDL